MRRGSQVYSGSRGFTWQRVRVAGFIQVHVPLVTPRVHRVHSGSSGFNPAHICVAVFFRVRVGALGCA